MRPEKQIKQAMASISRQLEVITLNFSDPEWVGQQYGTSEKMWKSFNHLSGELEALRWALGKTSSEAHLREADGSLPPKPTQKTPGP